MKRFYVYLSVLLLGITFVGCNDDFDTPPMVVPQATHTPNMTIAEFKAKYWQDLNNYIDTVKDDIVIHGWVTGNDVSGNIYKSLYISDGTAGFSISVNGTSLYNTYRIGQEIVINMKDCFVGKYNGQQQIGYPQYYEKGDVWEATFLPLATFQAITELNSLPNPSKVDTIPLSISDLGTDAETLKKWQGRLVRIDNVKFPDADGVTTFANADATTNRNIEDEHGNTLVMRNSNYASFRANKLPLGTGSVVGVLSYYNTSATKLDGGTWQLFIRDASDCIGFSSSTKGLIIDPYTVEEAIEGEAEGKSGWMMGYVVGAVAPEVSEVKSAADVEWEAPTTLDNTLVIAPSADCRDIAKCMVVALPQGTPFRQMANLVDWPEVLGTKILVKGKFEKFMGTHGITGNSGSKDEFQLSITTGGVTSVEEKFENGIPSDWTIYTPQGDKKWFTSTFDNNTYACITAYKGTKPPYEAWLISPAIDIKKAKSRVLNFKSQVGYQGATDKFEVYIFNGQVPFSGEVTDKINCTLAVAPSTGYSGFVESGDIDLSQYADGTYYIGFRYTAGTASNYQTWCIDDFSFGVAPAAATRGDFESFNSGTATATYGNYTTKAGWKATNASILKGGAADANPVFTFIGFKTGSTTDYAMACNLSGKTSGVGTLVSPEIEGGLGTLSFNYGYAYTESNGVSFRVDIKQGGTVVKSFDVTKKDAVKYTAYEFKEEVNLKGAFTIEVTNLCPSKSTSNKDRVALWNMTWTQN
ncbi:MAG: DUF5689 domain-containing protein [Bacteroidales bacterium]|nr:DUF5689 domain-containing protein [Bacteroidales bacterium]